MDISTITKRRSTPGILIFNLRKELVYANDESLELIPEIRHKGKKASKAASEIDRLCSEVVKCSKEKDCTKSNLISSILPNAVGIPYHLRAFPLKGAKPRHSVSQILILVEKIVLKHSINFEHAKSKFELTDRELDVLKLLCTGLANKEVAQKLSISEYTVKDHIKKLMQKTGTSSRTEIINRLS
jgi:DNA-binding CsgD family transcriptional regulator